MKYDCLADISRANLLMVLRRSAFKIQTHAMFLDTSLNSQSTVLSTIYQNLSETAMKYYRYAKAMGGQKRLPAPLLMRESIFTPGSHFLYLLHASPSNSGSYSG